MRALVCVAALLCWPASLAADLNQSRFEACSAALAALRSHADYVHNKVRDGFHGCRVVSHDERACNWDDPKANTRNGNCLVCVELVQQQDAWLARLQEHQASVSLSCGYPIGLSVGRADTPPRAP